MKSQNPLYSFLLLLFFGLLSSPLMAQSFSCLGMWEGTLHYATDSLRIVMVVDQQDDTISVVLDSPDQYVTDIPVTEFKTKGDTLFFSVKSLGCSYRGIMMGDSIVGKFRQNGKKMPLTLYPAHHRQLFPRPQEPQEPFPYTQHDRTFPFNEWLDISGTLTLPTMGAPKAVVVLVSGSGWQDRDETIMAHKPFKLLADHLTRQGYAVFRYDDAPYTAFQKMTTLDFAEQVKVIVDSLRQDADLQGCPMGLLGHSEGGMVAWIVAADRHDIDFVISMAGMGTPLREVLLYQAAENAIQHHFSAEMLRASLLISDETYALVERAKDAPTAARKVSDYLHARAAQLTDEERIALNLTDEGILISVQTLASNWFFTLMHLKPAQYLKKVTCPVLALNGESDKQVDAVENVYAIRDGLKRCPSFTPCILPNLNHLFQECETGYFDEYGLIEQTLSPLFLEQVSTWLNELMEKKNR